MSPHASITAPPEQPLLPRQTGTSDDPYGLSSLYAELSSLYPELYSSYSFSSYDSSYYSSLLDQYSSYMYSLTRTDANTATGLRPTATAGTRTTSNSLRPTAAAASGTNESGSSGGLSSGAKIGIGVGVTLGVLLLAGVGIFLWCMGKRKGKKSSTTIVAPAQPNNLPAQQQHVPPPPQMGYMNNQGYMQGYPQPTMSPPPQYIQQQQVPPHQQGMAGAYGAYGKEPAPNTVELEQEYHFARPGVIEIGDGVPEPQQQQGKKK